MHFLRLKGASEKRSLSLLNGANLIWCILQKNEQKGFFIVKYMYWNWYHVFNLDLLFSYFVSWTDTSVRAVAEPKLGFEGLGWTLASQ